MSRYETEQVDPLHAVGRLMMSRIYRTTYRVAVVEWDGERWVFYTKSGVHIRSMDGNNPTVAVLVDSPTRHRRRPVSRLWRALRWWLCPWQVVDGEPPVRVCCGQRHYGPMCPDGLVMCCQCFDRVPVEALSTDADGHPEDVCRSCARLEAARTARTERTRT